MATKKEVAQADYFKLSDDIRKKIISARIVAYRSLNREMIRLYWDIGKKIVERQEKFGSRKNIIEELSKGLMSQFKGRVGFSPNNLWWMRNFYLAYKDNLKLAQLVQEIPWGQNIVIIQKIKSLKAKEYYIKATIAFGWSKDVLIHQIEANAYKYRKQRDCWK